MSFRYQQEISKLIIAVYRANRQQDKTARVGGEISQQGRGKTRVHREILHGLLLNKFHHPERTRINNMGHAAAGIKNWASFVAE